MYRVFKKMQGMTSRVRSLYAEIKNTELLIGGLSELAALRPSARTVTATARVVIVKRC